MSNKAIAWGLIITMACSFSIGVMEGTGALSYAMTEGLYVILGIAMIFFGVFAIVRLFKS